LRRLTDQIASFSGSVEDSSVARLAGRTSILLSVRLPVRVHSADFEGAIRTLFPGSHIQVVPETNDPAAVGGGAVTDAPAYLLRVRASDRTGIVRDVATHLESVNAELLNMQSWVEVRFAFQIILAMRQYGSDEFIILQAASHAGNNIFHLKADLKVPSGLNMNKLESDLADAFGVSFH
jgi:glycine cleavage system regulatory protein